MCVSHCGLLQVLAYNGRTWNTGVLVFNWKAIDVNLLASLDKINSWDLAFGLGFVPSPGAKARETGGRVG